LILFGGGHADYGGNELYAFDAIKLAWQRLTDPYPNPKTDDSDENPDGTPQSRHTYGGLAYLADCDRFFVLGGPVYTSCNRGVTNKVWTFDLAAQKWKRAKEKVQFDPHAEFTCAYDPLTRKLWFCNCDMGNWAEIWCYQYEQEKWTPQLKSGNDLGFGGVALDTKRGLLIALSGGKVKAYDVRGNAAPQTWQTTGCEDFQKQAEVGFDYDPVADKLVGWSAEKVFVLDPEKKEWTVNNPPGAPKPSGNGTFGRWRYVPSVNAFVLVTGWDNNVHFYKLTAGPGKIGK
jgi:hypothetical protein